MFKCGKKSQNQECPWKEWVKVIETWHQFCAVATVLARVPFCFAPNITIRDSTMKKEMVVFKTHIMPKLSPNSTFPKKVSTYHSHMKKIWELKTFCHSNITVVGTLCVSQGT